MDWVLFSVIYIGEYFNVMHVCEWSLVNKHNEMSKCMLWFDTWLYDYENVYMSVNVIVVVLKGPFVTLRCTILDRRPHSSASVLECHIQHTNLDRLPRSGALKVRLRIQWEDHWVVIFACYCECEFAHCSWHHDVIILLFLCMFIMGCLVVISCL